MCRGNDSATMRSKTDFRKPPFSLDRSRHGDLAEQIATGLRTAIETGYYPAGSVLPPVRDLAQMLDVSKGIAELALSRIREEGLVSPRPRVGSVVCAPDRPLWKGHVVTVIPPGLGNPFDTAIHAVVRDRLTAAGYLVTPVTVMETRPGRFDDFALLDTVLRQQTDLVIQLHQQETISRHLSRNKIPFIRLSGDDEPHLNCVGAVRHDFGMALAEFAEHCREAGVKSVLQVADVIRADATELLARIGVSVTTLRTPASMRNGPDFDLTTWAADTFHKRLAKGHGWIPDLLFFQNDHLTTGAMLALGVSGVRIPEDVRVVTWANRRYGPVYLKPLTRMEIDSPAIGATLADCVLEYLKTGAFPDGVVVGPEYIRGETF